MDVRARHTSRSADLPHPVTVVGALVVATFLVAFGALHYGFFTRKLLVDTPLYERYGDLMVHRGEVPYRDFAVEYPPGALPVFALPSLVAPRGDFERYRLWFELLMLTCGAAAAAFAGAVLALQRARPVQLVAGTVLAGAAPVALGPVVLSRFDLWPAALSIAGLAALVVGRRRLGHGILGCAVAAKLYPAVVLPLTVAYVWRRHGRREGLVCAGVAMAVVAAFFAPFAALAPAGVWHSLHGQATRPLQIESLGAAFLLASHQAFGYGLTEAVSHGSDNLVGGIPNGLASLQGLLAAGALVALWVAFARGPADRDRLLRYATAAVCAFIALGRVLSPQYLMWLVPLVPLVRGRRRWIAYGLFLAAMVLTQLWFPYRYINLVYELDPRSSWFVLARDLVLVALLVVLALPRRRLRAGGVAVVVLAAAAAAAVVAGAVAAPPRGLPAHAGVLELTGVASSCGVPAAAPVVTRGNAAYDVESFRAPSRASCIAVVLRARGGAQAFAAAYAPAFDPAAPARNHRGDTGTCTNLLGNRPRTTRFSFRARADEPFAVDVEPCNGWGGATPYTLAIGSSATPVPYRAGSAVRTGALVVVRWRGGPAVVYREQHERLTRLGTSDGRFADAHAPEDRFLRYWLKLPGTFGWYGPLAPG